MNKIAVLISLCFAGSLLLLPGCSKSTNSHLQAGSGGNAEAGPTDLKMKWPVGTNYSMEMDLKQATDIKVSGQPIHQDLTLTQGIRYKALKDLDNGGHQLELEFENENITLNQNGKEILNYDSTQNTPVDKSGPAASVAAVMGAMLNAPLDYTLAADGTVEKIDGYDAMMSRINAAVPDKAQRASLGQMFDQDTLKQYCAFAKSLPDHPVNIGDAWSASDDLNTPTGVLTVDTTYTYKDWEQHDGHNCVHLMVTGDIKTKSASAATLGAVVKIEKGTLNGEAWFDPDLGMFVDIKNDQDLTMDVTTRGSTFTEHQKQNVDVSLVDISP
jgi:hypothetical protein